MSSEFGPGGIHTSRLYGTAVLPYTKHREGELFINNWCAGIFPQLGAGLGPVIVGLRVLCGPESLGI